MKKNCYILLFILLYLCGCSKQKNDIKSWCLIDGCYNNAKEYSAYCTQHSIDDLIVEDNNIKLTDFQITKCRKVVDDYCKKIIKSQSNIQSIYIIDDIPETSAFYIMYQCYVTVDDDVKLATIYVEKSSDESFKVKELEYNDN